MPNCKLPYDVVQLVTVEIHFYRFTRPFEAVVNDSIVRSPERYRQPFYGCWHSDCVSGHLYPTVVPTLEVVVENPFFIIGNNAT